MDGKVFKEALELRPLFLDDALCAAHALAEKLILDGRAESTNGNPCGN
jgi:hypothetical protein